MTAAAHPASPHSATPYAVGLGLLMPLLAVPLLFALSVSGSLETGNAVSDFLARLFVGGEWLFLSAWPVSIALALCVLARRPTRRMRQQAWISLGLAASWVAVALWIVSLIGQ